MSNIWKEKYKQNHHANKMAGCETTDITAASPFDNISDKWVYFVETCGFTFQFMDLSQLKACLKYYQTKIHPSTRENIGAADHWEVQRWYEMLPSYLRKETKRQEVVKALEKAKGLIEINKVNERII